MANRCEHRAPRWWGLTLRQCMLVALLFACKATSRDAAFDDPVQASVRVRALVSTCEGVTRAIDRLAVARLAGRDLAGLVDEAIASTACKDKRDVIKGNAIAHQLARARIADAQPEVALAALTSTTEPAIRFRRAELYDRMGRSTEALHELAAIEVDEPAIVLQRTLRVSVAARAGNHAEVSRVVATAPLADQPRLAFRAAADASEGALASLSRAGTLEVALAASDRLEQLQGPAAVLDARERIVTLDASVAEHWDALARARIAAGKIDDALAAWERAIEIAPAQPAFRIAPIRALVIAEQPQRARARAEALAKHARAGADVELLVTASSGAAAAGDAALAVALARDARARRPGDGRLAFLVAQRLAETGDVGAAAAAYTKLLACGAHGRAWHRHEVAGRLMTLAGTSREARTMVLAAIVAPRTCTTVEPDDLATYVSGLQQP